MGAASERPRLVNETIAGYFIEQWTGASDAFRQRLASGRTQRLRRDERFAFRQVRSATGELEMAAFFYPHAVAIDRSCREIGIDLANFFKSCVHSEILAGIDDPGYSAIAFPAIHPVAQAA